MKRLFFIIALLIGGAALAQNQNLPVTLLTSAARTATVSTADQTNVTWTKAHIIVNVSAYTSGTFTPKIQARDPVSGAYYDVLVGTAINSTGTTVIKVGPGMTAVANASSADILPRVWRVTLTGASTPIMTLSVGAFLAE